MLYAQHNHGILINNGTFTYTYNAAGRMVACLGTNRLAESVTVTLVYTYNAQGLRVAQSVIGFGEPAGDMTSFAWDWASGLTEMLNEGSNLYLVGHETLGQWDGANWAYYLPDALGSVRQTTDDAGAVLDSREWTPFGVEVGAGQAGLGYTGEWQDPNIELLYLRARWYAPQIGSFLSRDSVETEPPYQYVRGNPSNRTDPTGHYWYDPINDHWVYNDVSYLEAPIQPKIEFQDDPDLFMTREDAFAWIMPRAQHIEAHASMHGVPPELVAGMLAVEIDNDFFEFDFWTDASALLCYELVDMWQSKLLPLIVPCMCEGYLGGYSAVGIGVGIAQIHVNREGYDWWAVVQHYREQGYQLPIWADDPVRTLLTGEGSIEGTAIFGRALADLRKDSYASHTSDLSINDMGLIFVAYRFGIVGFNDKPTSDSAEFGSIADFQDSTHNASDFGNGRFSMPYFEAFQFYFAHRDLYEAAYPEWRSQ